MVKVRLWFSSVKGEGGGKRRKGTFFTRIAVSILEESLFIHLPALFTKHKGNYVLSEFTLLKFFLYQQLYC